MRANGGWKSTISVVGAIVLLGCDAGTTSNAPPRGSAADEYGMKRGTSRGASQRERQAALLNRLRSSDPQFRVIDRAIFNEQNELGIILDRSVEMAQIPPLMRSLLTQMAREFPGEDLKVIAYAPGQPPIQIGIARLDARTREMTYTPAQRNY